MSSPINVLLIEDNPGDIELIKAGFEEERLTINLLVISDGQEAVDFFQLQKEAVTDLVLLDINLPKVNGFEILNVIRSMTHCQQVPVIVLTSSEAEIDIIQSYASKANSFISKPVDATKFLDVVKSIGDFWLTVVKLPSRC